MASSKIKRENARIPITTNNSELLKVVQFNVDEENIDASIVMSFDYPAALRNAFLIDFRGATNKIRFRYYKDGVALYDKSATLS